MGGKGGSLVGALPAYVETSGPIGTGRHSYNIRGKITPLRADLLRLDPVNFGQEFLFGTLFLSENPFSRLRVFLFSLIQIVTIRF